MGTYIFLIVTLYSYLMVKSQENLEERKSRFWPDGFVRFENSLCTGLDGRFGTCYTRRYCNNIKGVRSGPCPNRISTCCNIQRTCGSTSAYNNTYFVNPNFPAPFSGSTTCYFNVQRCNENICQARIDFLTLTLSQPNGTGYCVNDVLRITGAASRFPPLCGENSGQHVYLDFNGDEEIRITVFVSSAVTLERIWKMQIAQLGCSCPTRALPGCFMQYFDLSGVVRSFNYAQTVSSESVEVNGAILPGTRQIANQNYGVCIAMQPGYCGIEWSQASGDIYSFTVSNSTTQATGSMTVGTPAAAVMDCTTDFVVIPNPIPSNNVDRFCGNGFSTVTSFSKPFILTVVTNGDEIGDDGNRGFALAYTQIPCGSTLNL